MLTLWLAPHCTRSFPSPPALTFAPWQNLIFRFLQNKQKIKIWLFNNNDLSIEGQIIVRFYVPHTLLLQGFRFRV